MSHASSPEDDHAEHTKEVDATVAFLNNVEQGTADDDDDDGAATPPRQPTDDRAYDSLENVGTEDGGGRRIVRPSNPKNAKVHSTYWSPTA